MRKIYLYVTDTMADWEIGYVTAEINSRRFFKKGAPEVCIETIGMSKESIKTMGGLTIIPDRVFKDTMLSDEDLLLLPGADTWADPKHRPILDLAMDHLSRNGTVGAICGATLALAFRGALDNRNHTSNGPGFLEMLCPVYKGKDLYIDKPAVADNHLITASSIGGLQWAQLILKELKVFSEETLEAWTKYFTDGRPEDFFALMNSLPKN